MAPRAKGTRRIPLLTSKELTETQLNELPHELDENSCKEMKRTEAQWPLHRHGNHRPWRIHDFMDSAKTAWPWPCRMPRPSWSRMALHRWSGSLDGSPLESSPSTRKPGIIAKPRLAAWPLDARSSSFERHDQRLLRLH